LITEPKQKRNAKSEQKHNIVALMAVLQHLNCFPCN